MNRRRNDTKRLHEVDVVVGNIGVSVVVVCAVVFGLDFPEPTSDRVIVSAIIAHIRAPFQFIFSIL